MQTELELPTAIHLELHNGMIKIHHIKKFSFCKNEGTTKPSQRLLAWSDWKK